MSTKMSTETRYVGTMMALIATQALARNLAAYLAGVERVDGSPSEEGRECVARLIDEMLNMHLDTAVTDLKPGTYDAEGARDFAWDTIKQHAEFVLRTAT